ncbi:hypothetical protein [Paracraurococcus lichenis]|uniref:Alginate export domain-containing protein n=1 Tax=Paracraurococcus lichenis TaxID=3064888 RepID=A0ABT9E0T5_9PROT|nr:hypothetical protein [Paracraurococcus sp. LOR1-02]MDO9709777.1 hypothetical protein [Paracraurococcus sp. LOR1-02]
MRNVGPGVADRTGTQTRGGSDDIVFGGEVQTTLELDVNGKRRETRANGNLFTESLAAAYLLLPYGFAVNGVLRLEQTDKVPDGRGSVFREQTLWADELYLTWSRGVLDLFGGKIHPRFGSAWDRGPGLFGTDFGREYELTEKIGVGARLWASDLLGLTRTIGSHNLQVEVFEADRTALSWGALSGRWAQQRTSVDPETGETVSRTVYRWQNRRGTGGPDNTDFAGGTVVSMAGYGIPMPRGLAGYTASYAARKAGQDAVEAGRAGTEQSWTLGGFWTIPLPQRLEAAPFAEFVHADQAGGYRNRTTEYLTAGFDLRRTPWTISYAYLSNWNDDRAEGLRGTRVQQTASLTYDLYFVAPLPILRSASVTVGWRRLREAGEAANDFGGLLGWAWKF